MPTTRMWRGIELQVADPGTYWPCGAIMVGDRSGVRVRVSHACGEISFGDWVLVRAPGRGGGDPELALQDLGERLDAIADLIIGPRLEGIRALLW